jgi:Lon protease-like protein
MFPLGSVLLPGMVLPLRVFEPRYRVLVDTVLLADEPEFGSVLIERGSEVGGGDVRSDTGCVARVADFARHPDGQVSLLAVGVRRLRVLDWLEDDPFPRAEVQDWPDEPARADDPTGDRSVLETRVDDLLGRVVALSELAAQLGLAPTLDLAELDDDLSVRVFQLATVSPLGALDRLRILSTPGLSERIDLVGTLLAEQQELLEARRRLGDA